MSQNRNWSVGFTLVVPALFVLFLVGLVVAGVTSGGSAGGTEDGRIRVVATIGQIADAAKNVGGELVQVEALMGAGIDPHLYKASEGDIFDLLDADLILYNGLHLEGRMGEVLDEFSGEKVVVAVAEGIPHDQLLFPEQFAGQYDPHVWFDPTLWAYGVERVRDALIEVDPDNEGTYTANAEAYLAQLAALDAESLAKMATVPEENRTLVTAHDAFNYFGRHYGLEVVGLQGLSTDTEAGVGDLQQVTKLIVELGVPAIFIESSVSPRTIEAVQAAVRDRGHQVSIGGELFSDAMGAEGTEEGTYIGMVEHNVNTITEALGGSIGE